MGKIYFDVESCGFSGPAVLIQWSDDEGQNIHLFEPWKEPIYETLRLIESFVSSPYGVVGFNLTFDWFQLCKLYTMFSLYHDYNVYPEDIVEDLGEIEERARDGGCLKPVKALDLMLEARKGRYQSTMNREDIRIRRIPTQIAWQVAEELERRVPLPDIYFARRKNQLEPHFKVYDVKDKEGELVTEFKDIVLRFAPSSALKALVVDALKIEPDTILLFADINIDEKFLPVEHTYAPFAKAIGERGNWKGSWPDVIQHHIDHWAYNELARKYAAKDVEYLPKLWQYFGCPKSGDDDSELACLVGAVRWKGFAVDIEGIRVLRKEAIERKGKTPTAPEPVRRYINQVIDPIERVGMAGSTGKVVLEEIANWHDTCPGCETISDEMVLEAIDSEEDEEWENFDPEPEVQKSRTDCQVCSGLGYLVPEAAKRSKEVLAARRAMKEVELYDKLITAGRLHPDFSVIGTKSSRMSGAGGLNAQGIKRDTFVREKFPLAFEGECLGIGDFESFEVVLASVEYGDKNLDADLKLGKKIHGLFGVFLFPDKSYDEIIASKGQLPDYYTPSKSGVFALIYAGDENTLKRRLNIPLEVGERAYKRFCKKYPGVGAARQKMMSRFMTMRQSTQYGRIEWNEPDEYVESFFGFKRYFTLEHKIEKALYDLATSPPKTWRNFTNIKCIRREREQSALGAVQSALFGAAFGLQGANMRAAANHRIQSSGGQITKAVQRKVWDLQPPGYHPWYVRPMNCHDELASATHPDYVDKVAQVVDNAVESFRERVPLIKMDWNKHANNWAEK